jgi:hypothetical protein
MSRIPSEWTSLRLLAASAFNPKLQMIRSKTLMQGHDGCNRRYVMEG